MILLKQMSILFLIMLVGFIARKRGIFGENSGKLMSAIVVNIANPAMILSGCINQENRLSGRELLMDFGLAVLMYGAMMLIAQLAPLVFRVQPSDRGMYKVMTVFTNMGFMGFPLISATYGQDALVYASLFLLPFNVLIYTYGIRMICGSSGADGSRENPLKKIFNVGIIACIVALFFYCTGIRVPETAESVITYLSNLTAPLSMLVIGDSLTQIRVKELVTDVRLVLFVLARLIAVPVVFLLLLRMLPIDEKMLDVCLIVLATPVASMSAMLAQEYGGDTTLASRGIALSTVLSVATIPLVSLVI